MADDTGHDKTLNTTLNNARLCPYIDELPFMSHPIVAPLSHPNHPYRDRANRLCHVLKSPNLLFDVVRL